MSTPIINKVAQSELITLDPVQFLPKGDSIVFDLKEFLFMGLILKEKDFREAMKTQMANISKQKCSAHLQR
jgi:hypothetical protein